MPPENKNLAKLENLVKLLSENVTKEDFTKAFEQVLQVVLKIEQQTSEAITSLEKTYTILVEQMGKRHDTNYSDLKKQVNHVFVEERMSEMQKMIDAKIASMKNGADGRTPTPEALVALMRPLIPPPRKGDDGKTFPVEQAKIIIAQLFNEAKKEFGQKFQQTAERSMAVARKGKLGFSGQSVIVPRPISNIIPTGSINGINADFILPKTPAKNGERVFLNGVRMRSGSTNDYTIASRTITFSTAPLTNDIILVDIDF